MCRHETQKKKKMEKMENENSAQHKVSRAFNSNDKSNEQNVGEIRERERRRRSVLLVRNRHEIWQSHVERRCASLILCE